MLMATSSSYRHSLWCSRVVLAIGLTSLGPGVWASSPAPNGKRDLKVDTRNRLCSRSRSPASRRWASSPAPNGKVDLKVDTSNRLCSRSQSPASRSGAEGTIGVSSSLTLSDKKTESAQETGSTSSSDQDVEEQEDRFSLEDPRMLHFLEENGYAIVKNVLASSKEETHYAESLLWDFLEEGTDHQWDRNDMTTWYRRKGESQAEAQQVLLQEGHKKDEMFLLKKIETFLHPTPSSLVKEGRDAFVPDELPPEVNDPALEKLSDRGAENGILHKNGAGQSAVAWFVRLKAKKVFERVWSEKDLITSFDALGIFRPWQHGCGPKTISRKWLHVDQGRELAGKKVGIQGLVTLYDQTEATGGLYLVPGSHKHHEELCDAKQYPPFENTFEKGTEDPNYIELLGEHRFRKTWESFGKLIRAKAGDLILWDSKALHCNVCGVSVSRTSSSSSATLPRLPPRDRLLRAVVYVSMSPRKWATAEILEDRQKAFAMNGCSTHWPASGFTWNKDDVVSRTVTGSSLSPGHWTTCLPSSYHPSVRELV
ncbi:unnamed protein product [Amoebophrya sp. A25]|nr:unnamed protein product [Amoebophrya sp. A25]|eukprot:GSA25T00021824001.1